jgi:hypothetical protein
MSREELDITVVEVNECEDEDWEDELGTTAEL